MSLRRYLHLPYSSDRVFGFLFLALLTASLVVVPQFNDPIETPKLILWSALLGLSIIFLIKQSPISTKFPRLILGLLGAFIVWSAVATVFSFDQINSLVGVLGRMTNSLWFFIVWAMWMFALSTLAKEKFLFLLKSTVVIGGVIAGWAVLQNYGIGFYGGIDGPIRALVPSFLGNPNFIAMYLATTLPLVVWLGWQTVRSQRSFWIAIGAVQVWAVVLMASRGALLAVLGGLAVLAILVVWQKGWRLAAVIAVSFLLIAGLSFSYLVSLSPERTNIQTTDLSANQRFYVWDHAARFVQSKPLTGSGLGNYFLAYRQNQSSALANSTWFDDSHNIVMHLAATGGIPLAALFVALIIVALWQSVRAYIKDNQLLLAVLMASLVSWGLAAMFNPVSLSNWLLVGVLIAGLYQAIDRPWQLPKHRFLPWAGGITGFALIVLSLSFLSSELLIWQAKGASEKKNYEQAEFLSGAAKTINPTSTAAWSAYAYATRLNKGFEGTINANEHLARLHPRSALTVQLVYTNYYALYKDTGEDQYRTKAIEFMKKYEQANSNYFATYQDLTFAYLAIGENDEALRVARRHVLLNGANPYPWQALARVYQARNEREPMLSALEQAFAMNPTSRFRHYLDWVKAQPDITKHDLPFEFPKL